MYDGVGELEGKERASLGDGGRGSIADGVIFGPCATPRAGHLSLGIFLDVDTIRFFFLFAYYYLGMLRHLQLGTSLTFCGKGISGHLALFMKGGCRKCGSSAGNYSIHQHHQHLDRFVAFGCALWFGEEDGFLWIVWLSVCFVWSWDGGEGCR